MAADNEDELTPEQQAVVDGVAAARERGRVTGGGLPDAKQDFPIGMRPDGTLNVVDEAPDSDDSGDEA